VGQDLRALSAAASQLANDFGGQPVTTEMVKQYFGGRAEAKSFTVADHTLMGRASKALEELRWALDRGTAPVLVSSAMSSGLRSLAKYKSEARGWEPDGIADAIRVVARADADVKGQASDPSYALERMVLSIVRLRSAR
jgi:DNA polymerase-3 subunit delta